MITPHHLKCFAIIVTYSPDIEHIKSMVKEILSANISVIIYDNTPISSSSSDCSGSISELYQQDSKVCVIGDGENNGLSIAFNRSIRAAYNFSRNIDGFIFFDQDSHVSSEKLEKLILDYKDLIFKKIPVGVIGATPVDSNGEPYRVRPYFKNEIDLPDEFSSMSFVISSFSFIPTTTIEKVGYFDERLFIDLVDSEYSFRCQKVGLLNIMTSNVKFTHVVGTARIRLLGRAFSVSNPLRNYYQARNLILVGLSYKWRIKLIVKLAKRFLQVIISGIYFGGVMKRICYFAKGVYDGLRGKGGAYNSD
jgi:rhamnosyltransferase